MAPPAAALWRYLVASVALVGVAFLLEGGLPRLSGRQWLGVTLLGVTGVALFNLCFMYGLERVSASRASLIVALNPAATLIGAALFLREPLTRNKSVGIAVALVGVRWFLATAIRARWYRAPSASAISCCSAVLSPGPRTRCSVSASCVGFRRSWRPRTRR